MTEVTNSAGAAKNNYTGYLYGAAGTDAARKAEETLYSGGAVALRALERKGMIPPRTVYKIG
jgi:hypothetical protein